MRTSSGIGMIILCRRL